MADADATARAHVWTIGDYPLIAEHLLPISEGTVGELDIQPDERVLDVAVGNGNASILAARRGAHVTGVDLTPAQIERARERCAAEGVDVELRVADAEALDVADASYDVVVSVMGVIFAPDPAAAVREMARACRPGGRIAMTSWSGTSRWAATWRSKRAEVGPTQPPLPAELWGSPDFAQTQFAVAGLDATIVTRDFVWRFPSDEVAFETFTTAAGGFMLYLEAMRAQGRYDVASDALRQTIAEVNVATDGTCHLPADYLLTTAPR